MSRFEYCYKIIKELEGGLANDPDDKGGKTNFGVTQYTYTSWLERHGMAHRDVEEITEYEVIEIYSDYWRDCKASYCFPNLDLLVFDCAINSGPSRAIKLLQRCLGIDVDGVFGRQTSSAVMEEMSVMGIDHVCDLYLKERDWWYSDIVRRDPTQRKFLHGWLNRLDKLREYV